MLKQNQLYILNKRTYRAIFAQEYNCWILQSLPQKDNWFDGYTVTEDGILHRVRESFGEGGTQALYYDPQSTRLTLDDVIERPEGDSEKLAATVPGYSHYLMLRGLITEEEYVEHKMEARFNDIMGDMEW